MAHADQSVPVGRPILSPARRRLLAVLLIVGLTAMSAYAGCHQLRSTPPDHASAGQIKAVEAIRTYLSRVERALRATDDTPCPEAPPEDQD